MTDPLVRIRDVALQLPGAEEVRPGSFAVEGRVFASVEGDRLTVRTEEQDAAELTLDNGSDWQSVEDRVARSWELTAPPGLLEAGGR